MTKVLITTLANTYNGVSISTAIVEFSTIQEAIDCARKINGNAEPLQFCKRFAEVL